LTAAFPILAFLFVSCWQIVCWARPAEEVQSRDDLLARADALIASGKSGQAIPLLEELLLQQPGDSTLEARLGKAYYEARDFSRAIVHLKLGLGRDADDPEVGQLLALSYVAAGQSVLAIPLLERMHPQAGTGEVDSSYLLGLCYLKAHEYGRARGAFARMYSVPEDGAAAHLLFARMLVREHLEHEALPELKKAIALNPQLPMAHFLLGEIYLHDSQPKLALEELNTEVGISPTVWLVYWRQGDAFFRLDDYERAEKALKRSIWLNETFSAPYVLLGQIELKKGDLKLAIGFLDRAARMDPNNQHAHYFLGQAYQQAGWADKAKEEFDAARALLAKKTSQLLPGVEQ